MRSGKFISTIFAYLEHFAWLCKSFAWSCEISFHFSPLSCSQNPFCFISHDCANFLYVHAKWKNIVFQLFFFLSFLHFLSFDSTSTTSKSTPIPNPNWLHCFFHYAFGSSSTLFVLFNLIHLFCHQFIKIIPWMTPKLHKTS